MQTRTVEQVESWESRPFSGGFESLHELSDEDFTGAVVAEDTWLFMLNGRVVGVFQGDIDEFEEESGTVYVAPHDSLPLLFSMKERGGSTRAKYFTNDTPIPEADETLSEANFTGYVELSENVLSGDYYLVYYGGKQMSSAFIGQSERLITGEDAYERAADEVGIYEVKDVSMNITEIPAPPEPESESRTAVGGAVEGAGEETDGTEAAEPTEESVDDSTDEGAAPDEAAETQPSTGPAETPAESTEAPAESTEAPAESTEVPGESTEAPAESTEAPAESTEAPAGREESTTPDQDREQPFNRESTEEDVPDAESAVDEADETSADRPETSSGPTEDPLSDRRSEPEPEPETDDTVATPGGETESTKDELQRMFEREEEWRQTRSIPALDPEETEQPEDDDEEPDRPPKRRPRKRKENEPSERTAAKSGVSHERVDELRRAIESREDQIEELSDSVETVKAERNEMEQELADLRAERDDLEERVSNLESALQRAKDQQASVDTTATTLEPGEALAGTNLFVRYESKGKPTLEALQGGEVDPEAVNENLKLEHHTKFEADEVRIQSEPFEEFLAETSTFRFVSWLVRELPYELVDSGKRTALGDLYEAIPAIDRIEFEGTVTVPRAEGSAETMEFGVVMRDRMGNPLIVAELNDDRDPVPVEEMSDLIEAAQAVGDAEGTFASAIFVTASFFQPAALEAAEGAASSGGLFSRSDKASYVKTANKSGFHLCLVEDRAESFHVTVPEL